MQKLSVAIILFVNTNNFSQVQFCVKYGAIGNRFIIIIIIISSSSSSSSSSRKCII